jgi:hypothetical protein
MTPRQIKIKRQLEGLLKKHRYVQDVRPDHREWGKYNPTFHAKIRLDQNNPKGWNGFEASITAYMRWDITSKELETLLLFLKKEFSYENN